MRSLSLVALAFIGLIGCSNAQLNSAPDTIETNLATPSAATHTIFMAGDSTMAIKEVKDWPETGWGVPFAIFFDESLRVDNRAMNGRSTRTFISEGRWQAIIDQLKAGDYVFIQFGHNDESIAKTDRYTTPAQYEENLTRFVRDVRAKNAEPILLSPITRRNFDATGKLEETHIIYSPLSRKVAETEGVTFIDMDAITRTHFQAEGDAGSRLRFMHIPPATHPNYPVGVSDNTHLNQLGAREVAQLVLAELKKLHHPLAQHLRSPDPKHLTLIYQAPSN
jgi:lysophospholipase L1-like esterase